jgi:uncharacterized protein
LARVTTRIPLFPLGTVLYPGLMLPLHIFEDRYRQLIRELVDAPEGAPKQFGVVAIRVGREVGSDGIQALHEIGCVAQLRQVEAYEDGRFDVVTAGTTRFQLRGVDDSRPYLQGDVDLLEETTGGSTADVLIPGVTRLLGSYQQVLLSAQGRSGELPELPSDPIVLSFLVAAALVLDLPDKQRLLAAPDAATRLGLELMVLRREVAVIRRLPSMPAVELTRAGYSRN